jgi:hypothetical protein
VSTTRTRGSSPAPPALPAVLAAVLAAVAVLAAGCGGSSGRAASAASQHRSATPPAAKASAAAPGPSRSAGASPSVIAVPPPPAGLHQTHTFPATGTPVFRAEMTDLWTAITTGRPRFAAQAFFPLTAYTQVKAIANPAADWQSRLFGQFRLDVFAAHSYVGSGARLERVIVPSGQASWIDPGVCYNAVGYWHVAGSRLVYRQHGRIRSIGIASLISWRGRWYVVHFGAVVRNGPGGVVDAPAAGPGVPGPPGGC